jgi:hypothetical protein
MECRCGCDRDAEWYGTGIDFTLQPYVNEPMCTSAAEYYAESAAILDLPFSKFRAPVESAQTDGGAMNEDTVLEVCDACGGDGGFDDTYIDTSHAVRSDWSRCDHCSGTGFILIDAEPIEMEDLA